MVKTLAESGLVRYEPYMGVRLTPAGEKLAALVLRRHRLIEQFLVQVLGMNWSEVHDEAERLEHAVSDTLVERMASVLGHPTVDPHGDPIPTSEGDILELASTPLAEVPAGVTVEIRQVEEDQPDRLRYIASIGLRPGVQVTVVDRQPFQGPITISVDGQAHVIGYELAQVVRCAADEQA
jgi:DtxR family Mn-dependent transcriptional regulator